MIKDFLTAAAAVSTDESFKAEVKAVIVHIERGEQMQRFADRMAKQEAERNKDSNKRKYPLYAYTA